MKRLIGKGKHIVKVGKHPYTNMILKPAIMRKERVQMQDTEDAFAINRLAT